MAPVQTLNCSQKKVHWFLLCGKTVTRFVKKPLLPASLAMRFLNFKLNSLQGAQVAKAVTHSFPLSHTHLNFYLPWQCREVKTTAPEFSLLSLTPLSSRLPSRFSSLNVSLTGK